MDRQEQKAVPCNVEDSRRMGEAYIQMGLCLIESNLQSHSPNKLFLFS